MWSTIFTIILLGTSIYFFYQNNFLVGVVLLVWVLFILFGYNLQRLIKGLGELITHSELEKKCNVIIELRINITEVLKHKILEELFEKLKHKKIVKFQNRNEWIDTLIENYKKKYKNQEDCIVKGVRYVWDKVKFNIKNNLLWKNGEIDFSDTVYHELFIPYEYKGAKEEEERLFENIEEGVSIRAFIVNGILKLQVGDFNKELSPKHLREGFLGVYQKHVTITSFPLMYFGHIHQIPQSYLNLSMYATDSYWEHLKSGNVSKDFTKDWVELNKEIAKYNYICNLILSDEGINDKSLKIAKKFNEKKDSWIKREEFKNLSYVSKDDEYTPDFLEEHDIHYTNKYLRVFIANYNEYKEKREKYTHPDYWEERP